MRLGVARSGSPFRPPATCNPLGHQAHRGGHPVNPLWPPGNDYTSHSACSPVRVAVFHDFLDRVGGGERVALVLARHFEADLYTTNLRPEVLGRMDLRGAAVRDLGRVPETAPLKHVLASLRFRRAVAPDRDGYVFSGNRAHDSGAPRAPGCRFPGKELRPGSPGSGRGGRQRMCQRHPRPHQEVVIVPQEILAPVLS